VKFIRKYKIGTNVIHNDSDVNMSGYTNKQLAKVQRMAEIFERFETKFDGKGLTEKAAKACAIFNAMKIKTVDDISMEIVVKK
jgi:hypothetical protein